MSVRVRYGISVALSSNANEDKDLGNLSVEVVTDLLDDAFARKFFLPASTSVPLALPLDLLASVAVLMVRTNAHDPNDVPDPISLYLNSTGNPPILISSMGDTKEGHFLVSATGITALWVANPGATDMDVTLFLGGDQA